MSRDFTCAAISIYAWLVTFVLITEMYHFLPVDFFNRMDALSAEPSLYLKGQQRYTHFITKRIQRITNGCPSKDS